MGRKIPWDLIPDIEYLDALGQHAIATVYPDGRITVDDLRTFAADDDQP